MKPQHRTVTRMLLSAVIFGAMTLGSATQAGSPANNDPTIPHERYLLDNGLEVLLHQDNSVPLVAVSVWYHVGSGDETPGRSGFAHLFEHMLFQGSKHVGEDKHFATLRAVGGQSINGTTNTDRTNYFEVVPSNQLETALWIEADRMGYFLPTLNKEQFEGQQKVVRNERRQSIDDAAYGKTRQQIELMLYPEGHPYRHMVIGKHEDLMKATVDDVSDFYKHWYRPANATIAIAGDFEMAEAKKLVEKWFGTFPKSKKPARQTVAMPVIKRQRTTIEDPFAKLTLLVYAWHTPAFFAKGDAEFDILGNVLANRRTGRLHTRLVLTEGLALAVGASQRSREHSSEFVVNVLVKTGADLAKIEMILDEELTKITKTPISQREFNRVVASQESRVIWGLQGYLSRAQLLQNCNHYMGKPDCITEDLDRVRKSSPELVRDMAAKYLRMDNRVEVITVPAKAKPASTPTAAGGK